MTIKIGLVLDDKGFSNLDLKLPEEGNNGVGGTQYCFLMLARYLALNYKEFEVNIFHFSNNDFPEGVKTYRIEGNKNLFDSIDELNIDILIVKNGINSKFVKEIEKRKIKTIVWAHNYIFTGELELLNNSEAIKRVVFVGKEQYDRYIDHLIIEKSCYIYNMFKTNNINYKRNNNYDLNVTYTGSLVPSKGFHILAKEWKNIVKVVPDAKLYIIGSGKLYNRNSTLGSFNIADVSYEKKFIPYLLGKDKKLIESVHFCGVMGKEKVKIYQDTAVGVINPTGRTETFGLSAVEMQACGIPVVTKASNGLLDTVINNKTGYLVHNRIKLRKKIIKLLLDRKLNEQFGKHAKTFSSSFNPDVLIKDWHDLLLEVIEGKKAKYNTPHKNYFNNHKWIRIINKKVKEALSLKKVPSIVELEYLLKEKGNTILSKLK